MCSIYKSSNFSPSAKHPLTYQHECQATEKLQATLRELEAAKVQLEAGSVPPGSNLVGWLVWLEVIFGSYAIFLP